MVNLLSKKCLFLIIACYSTFLISGTSPFTVQSSVILKNMVANSSQKVTYKLQTQVPPPNAVNLHCAFSSSSSHLTASFNNNGCTSAGGIGINSKLPGTVDVTVTVDASATGDLNGKIIFTQTNGRSPAVISSIPITISTASRTITFENHCSQSIWFGVSSSAVPAKNIGNFPCTTDKDCSSYTYSLCVNGACGGGACKTKSDCLVQDPDPTKNTCSVPKGAPKGTTAMCTYCSNDNDCIVGASCASNHQCFWNVPAPANAATSHYELAPPSGGTIDSATITIPDYSSQNGFALQWGGGFAGRTYCSWTGTKLDCKTANCNKNGDGVNGSCNFSEGFEAPSTQTEITFVTSTPDTYDVTVINGMNIALSMHPTQNSAPTPQSYNNPYICGSPGGMNSITTKGGTVGGCSWNFSPSTVAFRWVDNDNATTCSDDNYCIDNVGSSFRCGLTSASITGGLSQTTCGTPLGYWNQNEICAINSTYDQAGIVNCNQPNIGGTGNSIINLLACTGNAATSCYNVSASSTTCCGCTNWQNFGITVPTNSSIVQQCKYNNKYWGAGKTGTVSGNVLPELVWLKQACPSAYTYPFDDKSSTFTCPGNNGQSGVSYTVEFCPQS